MMFDVTLTVLSVVLSGASVSMDFMYTIQLRYRRRPVVKNNMLN